ncbi:Mitochondrial outer membrane protein porin [Asimina triloba]
MSKGPGLFSGIGKKAKGKISVDSIALCLAIKFALGKEKFLCNLVRTAGNHEMALTFSTTLGKLHLIFQCHLLTKDYSYGQKFTVSTYSDDVGVVTIRSLLAVLDACCIAPLLLVLRPKLPMIGWLAVECVLLLDGLTSTAVKKGGLSTGDISAQYKFNNTILDVKVDTESNVSTTLTSCEVVPSTKTIASVKLPDYNSGKVIHDCSFPMPTGMCQIQEPLKYPYFHEHATFTSAVALKQSPTADLTATVGTQSFAFGAEAGYDTASGSFTKYNAGISVTKPDSSYSVILSDKGDMLSASVVYHPDEPKRSAVVAEIDRRFSTNENTFTVGGAYDLNNQTTVKSRLNNHGQLGALLQHQLKPNSTLTISGEFDTKALDRNPRFGLSLGLKP